MSITVKRYSPANKEEWNRFAENAVQNSFLFHRHYMDYHQDRFHDHSLMIYDENKLIALLPANQAEIGIQSHGGLSYGGFLLAHELKLHHVLKLFLNALQYYHKAGHQHLIYKTYPTYLNKVPAQADLYALFLLEATLIRRDPACVVDLQQPLHYQQRRARSVSKAEKSGAWVRQSTNPDFFWNEILSPTLWERHQLKPVHKLEEIKVLMKSFPEDINLFECGLEESPTAGAVIFEMETTAHAQYIATTPEGRNAGTLDFLFDRLLRETYKHKRYFSFGISTEQQGKVLNSGLQDWKEGFGSRTFALDYYSIPTSNFTRLSSYA